MPASTSSAPVAGLRARRETRTGWLLVAPAALFLFAVFFAPVGLFAWRSVDNVGIAALLTRTQAELSSWDQKSLPDEAGYRAFWDDVQSLDRAQVAVLARHINYLAPGLRSTVISLRGLKIDETGSVRSQMEAANPRWSEISTWRAIATQSHSWTSYYLLRALDLAIDADGRLVSSASDETGSYRVVFARTFWISAVVTALCVLTGFPVAYTISNKSRLARTMFVAVLIPFWLSILVRNISWIILLQQNGILNNFLINAGFISEPLILIYNRIGIYIVMVHTLLPFFILSLYGVMSKVDKALLRAAASLGANPVGVFYHAYLPQVVPGVIAGAVFVFVSSLGFYITPALVGGGGDQMVGFFVALYTNGSVNWGLAAALGTLLLLVTLMVLGASHLLITKLRR